MERLVLFGNLSQGHVGRHFQTAARAIGIDAHCVDSTVMYGNGFLQRLSWHFLSRKPLHLSRAIDELSAAFDGARGGYLLVSGVSPLPVNFINWLRRKGVRCGIFLTDDPFNSVHYSKRFISSIPAYNVIFTPRLSNISDLYNVDAARVEFLPFAYDPDSHLARVEDISLDPPADVMFVGGADADRVPYVRAIVEAGFTVALYGGYWNRDKRLRSYSRGVRTAHDIRIAAKSSKVQVILVRRANRDGHVMRTYEAAASRSCLVVEDSPDHRELFGAEGDAVTYFTSPQDLVNKIRSLVKENVFRSLLANRAFEAVVRKNASTYADRLQTVLKLLDSESS